MNDTTPLYAVTCYEVSRVMGQFHVINLLDYFPVPTVFQSLREALEYADSGELSREALAVLATYNA